MGSSEEGRNEVSEKCVPGLRQPPNLKKAGRAGELGARHHTRLRLQGCSQPPEQRAKLQDGGKGKAGGVAGANDSAGRREQSGGGGRPAGKGLVARPARQIPQGGRRQSPGAPGPAPATWHPAAAAAAPPGARPGQPAARSRPRRPPPPGRPPAASRAQRGGAARPPRTWGGGGRREAALTAASERRQEADPAAS